MKEISKRLKEVDYILKKMDEEYIKKIPQEVFDYINENMDKSHEFNYDEEKTLLEQNLHIDTVSILTYINTEFLLDGVQKKELMDLLKKDELILEQEKSKKYNANDIFKKKNQKIKKEESKPHDIAIIEYTESIFKKLIDKIKNIFKR